MDQPASNPQQFDQQPAESAAQATLSRAPTVWDLPTRLFHWGLVACFLAAALTAFVNKSGVWGSVHLWAGYSVGGLIVWRFIWGFIGSYASRFANFPLSDAMLGAYAKELLGQAGSERGYHWFGHNPFGAVSVVLMLVLLGVQVLLGLFAGDPFGFKGPLEGRASFDASEIHEVLGYALMGLVGVHVCAVVFYRVVKNVNLVRAMLTGRHAGAAEQFAEPKPLYEPAPCWLALVVAVLVAATIGGLLFL